MIKPPDYISKFNSAKQRFLHQSIANFFERELPKLFGPTLRDKLASELVQLISKIMPQKEHVNPGQIVWNANDKRTRPDSPNRRFIPVVLTLISQEDIAELTTGVPMTKVAENAVARILREAHDQNGALLSMRDIGLFSWRHTSDISRKRKNYEKEHNVTLPHTGSLQDMGTCISHKTTILKKIIWDRKDPMKVAAETNHSLKAVENYIKDFRRVETCYKINKEQNFINQATGLSNNVVKQYVEIIENFKNSP